MTHNPTFMVVYVTHNLPEAHIIAGRLQSDGIRAWVHQEPAGSALGITIGQLGEVRVLVNDTDYDAALALLEADAPDELADDNQRTIHDDQ